MIFWKSSFVSLFRSVWPLSVSRISTKVFVLGFLFYSLFEEHSDRNKGLFFKFLFVYFSLINIGSSFMFNLVLHDGDVSVVLPIMVFLTVIIHNDSSIPLFERKWRRPSYLTTLVKLFDNLDNFNLYTNGYWIVKVRVYICIHVVLCYYKCCRDKYYRSLTFMGLRVVVILPIYVTLYKYNSWRSVSGGLFGQLVRFECVRITEIFLFSVSLYMSQTLRPKYSNSVHKVPPLNYPYTLQVLCHKILTTCVIPLSDLYSKYFSFDNRTNSLDKWSHSFD